MIRVLDFLLEEYLFDFPKTETAKLSGVSFNILETFFDRLLELGIIKKTRKIGNAQLYQLNRENSTVQMLLEIDKQLMLRPLKEVERKPVKVR